MKWSDAVRFVLGLDCDEALAATKEVTPDDKPPPDIDSTVVCKQKIRLGWRRDDCDGDCPGR